MLLILVKIVRCTLGAWQVALHSRAMHAQGCGKITARSKLGIQSLTMHPIPIFSDSAVHTRQDGGDRLVGAVSQTGSF